MMICQMKMMTIKKIWMRQQQFLELVRIAILHSEQSRRRKADSEQSRRRQENATGLDESLDEHEREDAYGSDHDDIVDDDDDDEVEPYFDIHDDDDGEGGSDVRWF
uniref:Uncharacterized protein n=1 Tax=Meloidogyne enterolobii TaxID=390850 RepID=A0A6V7W1E9_MELEN|nr:unnamed protein product [Meloidogyne enterolobii]